MSSCGAELGGHFINLKCLYSLSQAILKPIQSVRGHFVTLIEVVMRLIFCNPAFSFVGASVPRLSVYCNCVVLFATYPRLLAIKSTISLYHSASNP